MEFETVLVTLDATHKVPRHPGLPREEHRSFPATLPRSLFYPPDLDRRVVWKGFPTFRSHLRMRPVSRRHSRRGLVGGSTFRRTPISRSPLDKNPMPGHLSELPPVNAVNTKGQFFRASFGKKPQVPNTARQAASLPGDISRGKRSSMPQPKTRPDSPVPSLQGPCDRSLKSEVPCGSCLNWR